MPHLSPVMNISDVPLEISWICKGFVAFIMGAMKSISNLMAIFDMSFEVAWEGESLATTLVVAFI